MLESSNHTIVWVGGDVMQPHWISHLLQENFSRRSSRHPGEIFTYGETTLGQSLGEEGLMYPGSKIAIVVLEPSENGSTLDRVEDIVRFARQRAASTQPPVTITVIDLTGKMKHQDASFAELSVPQTFLEFDELSKTSPHIQEAFAELLYSSLYSSESMPQNNNE